MLEEDVWCGVWVVEFCTGSNWGCYHPGMIFVDVTASLFQDGTVTPREVVATTSTRRTMLQAASKETGLS